MKIIFLNTWKGTQEKQIRDFLTKENETTDIFCFQEVDEKMQGICGEILMDYLIIIETKPLTDGQFFYNAIYIKKSIEILESTIVLREIEEAGLGLHIKIKINNKIFNIINCHGVPYPGDKLDTETRIVQSREILNFTKNINEPMIIGGDFNLDPDTKSIKMFEEKNFLNLIKKFEIKTTRNENSWAKYPDKQLFADYVFVKKVEVNNFKVPDSDISDHLAMILEV